MKTGVVSSNKKFWWIWIGNFIYEKYQTQPDFLDWTSWPGGGAPGQELKNPLKNDIFL